MGTVYLDHAATTPLDPRVLEAMLPYLREHHGNPSSQHSAGRRARAAIDQARADVASACGAAFEEEIIFASSGSEANSLAVVGVLAALEAAGGAGVRRSHVLVSAVEHSSVLRAASLAAAEVTRIPVDSGGRVDPEVVRRLLRPGHTRLVSVMAANNETGTLQPVRDIAELCHEAGALLHCDAVQACGKNETWKSTESGADLISISGHKVYGPKGSAVLYHKRGTELTSIIHGGAQEHGLRGGTECVAGIVGLGAAASLAEREADERVKHIRPVQEHLERRLLELDPRWVINGAQHPRVPGLTSVTCAEPVRGDVLVAGLDLEGFAVSTGSACAAGTSEPSHVLIALGHATAAASRSLRISIGRDTTTANIDALIAATQRILDRILGCASE